VTPSGVMPKFPVTMDTKRRVRTSKEQPCVILAEFERSGVSAAQFAQRTGLKYSTFAAWFAALPPNEAAGAKVFGALVGSGGGARTARTAHPGLAGAVARRCAIGNPEASQVALMTALVRAREKPC